MNNSLSIPEARILPTHSNDLEVRSGETIIYNAIEYDGELFHISVKRTGLDPEQIEKIKKIWKRMADNAFYIRGPSDIRCDYSKGEAQVLFGKSNITGSMWVDTTTLATDLREGQDFIKKYKDHDIDHKGQRVNDDYTSEKFPISTAPQLVKCMRDVCDVQKPFNSSRPNDSRQLEREHHQSESYGADLRTGQIHPIGNETDFKGHNTNRENNGAEGSNRDETESNYTGGHRRKGTSENSEFGVVKRTDVRNQDSNTSHDQSKSKPSTQSPRLDCNASSSSSSSSSSSDDDLPPLDRFEREVQKLEDAINTTKQLIDADTLLDASKQLLEATTHRNRADDLHENRALNVNESERQKWEASQKKLQNSLRPDLNNTMLKLLDKSHQKIDSLIDQVKKKNLDKSKLMLKDLYLFYSTIVDLTNEFSSVFEIKQKKNGFGDKLSFIRDLIVAAEKKGANAAPDSAQSDGTPVSKEVAEIEKLAQAAEESEQLAKIASEMASAAVSLEEANQQLEVASDHWRAAATAAHRAERAFNQLKKECKTETAKLFLERATNAKQKSVEYRGVAFKAWEEKKKAREAQEKAKANVKAAKQDNQQSTATGVGSPSPNRTNSGKDRTNQPVGSSSTETEAPIKTTAKTGKKEVKAKTNVDSNNSQSVARNTDVNVGQNANKLDEALLRLEQAMKSIQEAEEAIDGFCNNSQTVDDKVNYFCEINRHLDHAEQLIQDAKVERIKGLSQEDGEKLDYAYRGAVNKLNRKKSDLHACPRILGAECQYRLENVLKTCSKIKQNEELNVLNQLIESAEHDYQDALKVYSALKKYHAGKLDDLQKLGQDAKEMLTQAKAKIKKAKLKSHQPV